MKGTANYGFNPALAVPFFAVRQTPYLLTTAYQRILKNDPQRVYFQINYADALIPGLAQITFGDENPVGNGWRMETFEPYEQTWGKSGPLVCYDWFARSFAGTTNIVAIEVRYAPSNGRL